MKDSKPLNYIKKNAEVHLDYFRSLLKNKAIFYTEKGSNKAKKLEKDARDDTIKQVEIYNVLGDYINNISKLESYAEKNKTGYYPF